MVDKGEVYTSTTNTPHTDESKKLEQGKNELTMTASDRRETEEPQLISKATLDLTTTDEPHLPLLKQERRNTNLRSKTSPSP